MVIIRDNAGNIIGKEASSKYVPTRLLRNRREQQLCDAQMGIVRSKPAQPTAEQRREAAFENRFIRQMNSAELAQ